MRIETHCLRPWLWLTVKNWMKALPDFIFAVRRLPPLPLYCSGCASSAAAAFCSQRASSLPNTMETKKFVEEIRDPRLGAVTDQFICAEPIDLVSGKAQLAVGRHHVGIDLQ